MTCFPLRFHPGVKRLNTMVAEVSVGPVEVGVPLTYNLHQFLWNLKHAWHSASIANAFPHRLKHMVSHEEAVAMYVNCWQTK